MALVLKIPGGRVVVDGFTFEYSPNGPVFADKDKQPPIWAKAFQGGILLEENALIKPVADGRCTIHSFKNNGIGEQYAEVRGNHDWRVYVTANEWTPNPKYNAPVSYFHTYVEEGSEYHELQTNEGCVRFGPY